MTGSDVALLDTNVLIYALDESSDFHIRSRRVLDQAASGEKIFCISPQTLTEFYSVVTNPRRVQKPRTAVEAAGVIETLLAMPGITLLSIPASVVPRWLDLARQWSITKASVFDLQLAATALEAGVTTVCTFNVADFRRIVGLNVITPE